MILMAAPGLPALGNDAGDDGALVGGGFGFMDISPWSDDFVDNTLVEVFQNTEIVSGEVVLTAGSPTGLVASKGISAPVGYRYDLVVMEIYTPGDSTVTISVLNATEDSTKVGYVNEPIPGFLKLDSTQVPILTISTSLYPEIRLQADLEAAVTDRPALLKWTVFFVSKDEWKDEFLGDGKMLEYNNLNLTGNTVEVDLSRQNTYAPGYGDYEAFPPLFAARYHDNNNRLEMGVWYPNAANDDYVGRTQMYAENVWGFVADDIDRDGYLDIVVANYRNGNDYTRDSWIMWGNESGTWDVARRANLATDRARDPALGDVNGDGYLDVLISCGGGSGEVRVFLNPKTQAFSNTHDIGLPGSDITGLASLDLDSDGYDDIVLAEEFQYSGSDHSRIYFGGMGGPDTTPDIHLPTGSEVQEVALDDFNLDGNVDVVFANTVQVSGNDRAQMFYGSESGPDATADFNPNIEGTSWGISVSSGDINGDGWPDIAYGRVMQQARMYVYWGDASGFSNARRADPRVDGSIYDIIVIDVNKDGYDDAVTGYYYGDNIYIYYGSSGGIDGDSDISMDPDAPRYIGVGAGKKKTDYILGSFVTKPINRPMNKKWDVLVLEGSTPPGTEMDISILDSGQNPILGFESVKGPDVDLAGVNSVAIHVRVTLKSLDMKTTPSVDRMFIKWMDKNVWREEFWGEAKVNSLMGFDVQGYEMVPDTSLGDGPEIIFAHLRNDATFNLPSYAYRDGGNLDYLSIPPLKFRVPSGAEGVQVGDFNDDGFGDVIFSVMQTSDSNFMADSPLFLGSPVGWSTVPDIKFPTIGAADVLVKDLNEDGYMDVVFAQERDATDDYKVNSTLFWGSVDGWNPSPDVEFVTTGASCVIAVDIDGDDLDDLVFANYRDAGGSSTTDSMIFYQNATGFDGSSAGTYLPTKGARAVAAGDIDGNGAVDLVFANELSGGFVEIDSFIYWGKTTGGFDNIPKTLATKGAQDVKLVDVDGDSALDVVFACGFDNMLDYAIDSLLYMGDGAGDFAVTPTALPTLGASSVLAVDLDGRGWKDLVFACRYDGATYEVNSRIYLGGLSGYGSTPDIELPTMGAGDVAVANLVDKDSGGYMSKVIAPEDPVATGVFETFRYTAILGAGQTGRIFVLDSTTGELLAETDLQTGTNEWSLADKFRVREHEAIQIMITGAGFDLETGFTLDDLWLNWSPRASAPPKVVAVDITGSEVYRTQTLGLTVNATDEYDLKDELKVKVEHRLTNTTNPWASYMVSGLGFSLGEWRATIAPRIDVEVGVYDLRVQVTDTDVMVSGWIVNEEMFEVKNNLPTAGEFKITPVRPVATSTLAAELVKSASDVESNLLTYEFAWHLNGEFMPTLTTEYVASSWLIRGDNWSVEVRAWDGIDLGPPAMAWKAIQNAGPGRADDLPDPEIEEDTPDSNWLVLADAFEDPDGDKLTYRVDPPPQHLTLDIDPDTGRVTITPDENWHGVETVVFWASDGEGDVNQTVTISVVAINDQPQFLGVTVNGESLTGDPIITEINQGQELSILINAYDVEGDDLLFSIDPKRANLNSSTGEVTFLPGNDDVGWLNFTVSLFDNVNPSKKVTMSFAVNIKNVNDPMDDPRIISPTSMEKVNWNVSVGLRGICTDPDYDYGQVLNYSWSSNQSGHLGYEATSSWRFVKSGLHNITLTVTDGEFTKTVSVVFEVGEKPYIEPEPEPNGDDKTLSTGLLIGIILAIVGAIIIVLFIVKRRSPSVSEMPPPAPTPEEEKRKALENLAEAVKETADQMEAERAGTKAAPGDEIELMGTGMKPTIAMKLTEESSDETAKLWSDVGSKEAVIDDAEKEALRLDNLTRKVQSAIQALPYGIPAPELRHISPNILAEEIATGARHELPDGRVLVALRGKWYYGDHEDSSNFLMPHKQAVQASTTPPSAGSGKGGGGGSQWEESG